MTTARQYIDLTRSHLCVQAKLLKDDDTNPAKADFVAPVNLTLHGLFKQVDVQIQQ